MSEQQVPQLRFQGLDDPWMDEDLEAIARFSKGQGYSKADVANEGMPLFLYGRLYTNYELAVTDLDTFAIPQSGSVISTGNDVLVPSSGETAEDIATAAALLQPGVIIGGDLNIIRPDPGVDSVFLALRIGHGKTNEALAQRAQGKTVVHLNNSDLQSLRFSVPSLEEQQAVGAFFVKLESLISQHRRQHQQLQQTRAAFLQRMLPQEGADEPAVRFRGFQGSWVRRELGDLGTARAGFGFPHSEQGGSEGIPFYKVSDMNLPQNQRSMRRANNYVTQGQVSLHGWRPVRDVPAVLFAKVGAAVFLGRKRVVDHPFLMDNNMIGFSLDREQWDDQFAQALFSSLDFSKLVQVGALPSFNPSAVEAMKVLIAPTREEQQTIGAVFSQFDSLISAKQHYIRKLQQVRSGLLQKMFI